LLVASSQLLEKKEAQEAEEERVNASVLELDRRTNGSSCWPVKAFQLDHGESGLDEAFIAMRYPSFVSQRLGLGVHPRPTPGTVTPAAIALVGGLIEKGYLAKHQWISSKF